MNADGLVTITDLFKWADFFFHIPVKMAVEIMADSSSLATFFEIDCLTGEGFVGVFFSAFLWYVFFNFILRKKNHYFTKNTNSKTVTNSRVTESLREISVAWGMLISPSLNHGKFFYQRIYGFWILLLIIAEFTAFLVVVIFLIMLVIYKT